MKLFDIVTEAEDKRINCGYCDWSWKESEAGVNKYLCHNCGHDNTPGSFDEFAQGRMKGANKIAMTAKEKGGDAMLTYHHFHVKNPYYKNATVGEFDLDEAKKEFNQCVKDLSSDMQQVAFQKLVGRIEVLGELIIKHK